MSFLEPQSDRSVRLAVDAYLDGRLRPEAEGEALFETRNSRYRLIDGVLYQASDEALVGAELVGWLLENGTSSTVSPWWTPGARAVLVDRRQGRHIVVTSSTRLLKAARTPPRLDALGGVEPILGKAMSDGSGPHRGGSITSHVTDPVSPQLAAPAAAQLGLATPRSIVPATGAPPPPARKPIPSCPPLPARGRAPAAASPVPAAPHLPPRRVVAAPPPPPTPRQGAVAPLPFPAPPPRREPQALPRFDTPPGGIPVPRSVARPDLPPASEEVPTAPRPMRGRPPPPPRPIPAPAPSQPFPLRRERQPSAR